MSEEAVGRSRAPAGIGLCRARPGSSQEASAAGAESARGHAVSGCSGRPGVRALPVLLGVTGS